jgi:hypothetical protein
MRFEYKYIVPMERLDAVRREILLLTTPDPFASREKDHQYTVRSIYFDTPRLNAYREKLEGIRVRRKLRVRSYNEQQNVSAAFLEIKKKVDQRVMKHRTAIRFEDLPALFETKAVEELVCPGRDPALSIECGRRFLFHIIRSCMMPVILVAYEREAYQGRLDGALRITLDKHLRHLPFPALSELYQEDGLRYVAPRFFIMEIKFNKGFSPWLQTIVKRHNVTRTSASKYALCISASAEFRPMLPKRVTEAQRTEMLLRSEVTA